MRARIFTRLPHKTSVIRILALATATFLGPGLAVAQDRSDGQAAPSSGALTRSDFGKLFRELQPPADEPWQTIPWHISILEAVAQAERENKPVFMWQADGWPLGCG